MGRIANFILLCVAGAIVSVAMLVASAQTPELASQTGHSRLVKAAVFSRDGRYLASASEDKTIRLWDTRSGVELRVFSGHSYDVNSVDFSPDGRRLVSGSNDKLVKIWDVEGGMELRTLRGHTDSVNVVAFGPDGRTIASGGSDHTIKLWDVDDGRLRLTIPVSSAYHLAFDPTGQLLAGRGDSGITIWNVLTGQEVRSLTGDLKDTDLVSMSFSRDGKTLAAVAAGRQRKLHQWNIQSGNELEPNSNYSTNIRTVAFSSAGLLMLSALEDDSIIFFNGTVRNRLEISGSERSPDLIFSADGALVASTGIHGEISLFDGATGKILHDLAPRSSEVASIAFSPDGKVLASGNRDGTVKMWPLVDEGGIRVLYAFGPVGQIAFSPSGEILAAETLPQGKLSNDDRFWDRLRLWEPASGKDVLPVPFFSYRLPVVSFAFSPKSNVLAVGGEVNDGVRLMDPVSRKEIYPPGSTLSQAGTVRSVTYTPDGGRLITCFGPSVSVWDAKTGVKLRELPGHSGEIGDIYALSVSADGRIVAAGSSDGWITLWDLESGRELNTLRGHTSIVDSVVFRPTGSELASGSWDGTVKIWDSRSGKELRTLTGHSDSIRSVAYSPDGTFLASASGDGTIKLWNSSSGSELATLTGIDKNSWLVTTPAGFFDGTPSAWKQLIWRFNNNTFDYAPVESYFNDFFHPGLLHDVLAGNSPKAKPDRELSKIDRRQPNVEIARINGLTKDTIAAKTERLSSTTYRRSLVEIDVTDNAEKKNDASDPETSGAQDLRLFRNGTLVSVWHGDVFRGDSGCKPLTVSASGPRKVRCTASVSMSAGDNNFTAYAFNASNVRSTEAPFAMKGRGSVDRPGTFYVLAIGVDKYADPSMNLNFAVADVTQMSESVAAQQQKLTDKKYASTQVIKLTDELATKENILQALNRLRDQDEQAIPATTPPALRAELEKIKRAEPEDAILIYYAGHGVAAGDRFYLLPQNFNRHDDEGLANQAISDLELSSVLESIDAGEFLMSIDACQSGQALGKANEGKAPMNSKGLAQLAYDKGMFILTAAQSQQAALEVSRLGHGLLTYALLDGLQKADKNAQNEITARKWLDYAVRTVPELQLEEMRKRDDQIKKDPAKRGAEIVFINGGNKNLPPEKRGLQTPRVFYRADLDVFPLVIARP